VRTKATEEQVSVAAWTQYIIVHVDSHVGRLPVITLPKSTRNEVEAKDHDQSGLKTARDMSGDSVTGDIVTAVKKPSLFILPEPEH
jgi:hypothetical protein